MESCFEQAPDSPRLKMASPRALVIIPPVYDFYFTTHRFSSIGPKIVTDLLEKKGMNVTVLNFALMMKNGTKVSLPPELSYLEPFILEDETGKSSFFKSYKRFGPSLQQCSNMISLIKADLCFICCFAFCYGASTLQLTSTIKKKNPETITVLGGAGVSAYPDFFLRNRYSDYTLSGEAEVNLCKFVEYLKSPDISPQTICGLGWKQNGTIHQSSITRFTTSEQIASPVIRTGESKSTVYFTVSLSRGCPLGCKFCSNRLCHGEQFRKCSQQRLNGISEQISLFTYEYHKSISLNFEDDNLLLDYPFWIQFIKSLKSKFPEIRFYAENGIDYRLMSINQCKELISLGFSQFNFSVGSINESIIKTSSRNFNPEHYSNLLSIANELSIPVISYFICGFADDTLDSVTQNLVFLSRHKTLTGISLFYPVPGIYGYEKKSIFDNLPTSLCCGSSAYPWNNSLSTQTMVTAFRLSRIINLSKSSMLNPEEKMLIDKVYSSEKLFTLRKKDSELLMYEVPNQDEQLVKMFFRKLNQNG